MSRPSTAGAKRMRLDTAARTLSICSCLLAFACVSKTEGHTETSPEASSRDIPCDPKTVLQSVCQKCHSNPPQNSAPFPLVTYDDTQVVMSGKPVWMYMRTALESGVMPLPPVTIAPSDEATLLHWLDQGAPARTATDICSTVLVDPPEAGGDAGEGGAGDAADGATVDEAEAGAAVEAPDGGNEASPDNDDADAGTDDQDADPGDANGAPNE